MTPHLVTKAVETAVIGTGNGRAVHNYIHTYLLLGMQECLQVLDHVVFEVLGFLFLQETDSTLTGVPSHFGGMVGFTAGQGQAQPWKVEPAASNSWGFQPNGLCQSSATFLRGQGEGGGGKNTQQLLALRWSSSRR